MESNNPVNPYEQIWKTRDLRTLNTPVEVDNKRSQFSRGLSAFGKEMQGTGYGLTALGSQALENVIGENDVTKGITDWGLEGYNKSMEESQTGLNAPNVPDIESIKNFSDLTDWGSYQLGKGLPMLGSLALSGGIGGAIARIGANQGVKALAKGAVGSAITKTVAEKATQAGLKTAEGQLVTDALKATAAKALRDTFTKGAIAGGFAGSFGVEGGQAFGEEVAAGVNPADAVKSAIAVGGINGALEFLPFYKVAKDIGMGQYAKKSIAEVIADNPELSKKAIGLAKEVGGRAVKGGLVGAGAEGITEGLQELVSIAGLRWAENDPLFADLSSEEWGRIKNSMVAGALVGGVAAGAGATIGGPQGINAKEPEVSLTTPAEVTPPVETPVVQETPVVPEAAAPVIPLAAEVPVQVVPMQETQPAPEVVPPAEIVQPVQETQAVQEVVSPTQEVPVETPVTPVEQEITPLVERWNTADLATRAKWIKDTGMAGDDFANRKAVEWDTWDKVPEETFQKRLPKVIDLSGMGSAIAENLRDALRKSVERTGKLPSAEKGSNIDQLYEHVITKRGFPRNVDTLNNVISFIENNSNKSLNDPDVNVAISKQFPLPKAVEGNNTIQLKRGEEILLTPQGTKQTKVVPTEEEKAKLQQLLGERPKSTKPSDVKYSMPLGQNIEVSEASMKEFEAVRKQFQERQKQETPFKNWFGKGTKDITANSDGTPITLYHGTNNPVFNQWDSSRAGEASNHPTSGLGFFMTADKKSAARYGDNLMALHAKINNPYTLTDKDLTSIETKEDAAKLRKQLMAKGYDGAVVKAPGGKPYVIAFESKQVKFVTNEKPTDSPDFRHSMPESGSVASVEQIPLIRKVSVEQLRSNIDTIMEEGFLQRAEDAGIIEVIDGPGPIGESGSWAGNKFRLYTQTMPANGSPAGVLLHEGSHAPTFKEILGDSLDGYLKDLDTLAEGGNKTAQDAITQATIAVANVLGIEHNLLTNGTKADLKNIQALIEERQPGLLAEEKLAYYIQYATETKDGAGFLRRLINAIKAWFAQTQLGQALKEAGIGFELNETMAVEWAKESLRKSLQNAEYTAKVREQVIQEAKQMPASERLGRALEAQYSLAGETKIREIPEESLDKVRAQYENTNQWMKAPNGEKTNLNERQWLQVRTPEFKAWFGDWENDSENTSRVTDENGEPKVVYHGGKFNINIDPVFKIPLGSKRKSNWQLGFGVHFADIPSEADAYLKKGGKTQAVYLRSKVLDTTQNRILTDIEILKWPESVRKRIDAFNKKWNNSVIYDFQIAEVLNNMPPIQASQAIIDAGYTGLKYTARANIDNRTYKPFTAYVIVNSPADIKSADPITYNSTGDVIPLSQRFNPNKNDIRYSMNFQQLKNQLWTDPTDSNSDYVNQPGLVQKFLANFVDFFEGIEKKSTKIYDTYSLLRNKKTARLEQARQKYYLPLRKLITESPWTAKEVGDMLAARHIKFDKVNTRLAERASYGYTKDLAKVLDGKLKKELMQKRVYIKSGRTVDGKDYVDANGNKTTMPGKTKQKLMFDLMNEYVEYEKPDADGKQVLKRDWEIFKDAAGGFSDGGIAAGKVRTVDDILKLVKKDKAKFTKIANLFDGLNRHVLDILEQGNLITADEHARLLNDKTAYAPLRRESYNVDKEVELLFQQSGKGGSRQISTRTGTTALSEPTLVLQNALAKMEAAAAAAERNLANNVLYEEIKSNPAEWKNWFSIVEKGKYATHDEDGFLVEKNATALNRADIPLIHVSKATTPGARPKATKLVIRPNMHNGRAVGFVRAVNNLDSQTLSGPMKILGALNNIVRWVNITASPIFLMTNAIKDPLTAAYNIQASEAAQYSSEILSPKTYRKAFKALKKVFIDGNRDPNDPDVQMVERFENAGGRLSFTESLREMDNTWGSFDAQVSRRQGNFKQLMKAKDKWIDGIENLNILFENVMRLSTFNVLMEHNVVTETRAARIAQDLTTNFTRRGYKTQAIGVWWLFFNPSVQGNYQVLRNMLKSKRLQALAGATIALAVMLDIFGRAIADDWDEIPEWDKERFIILPIKVGGDFVKIPAPWVYNILWRMGGMFGETLAGVRKPQDTVLDLAALTVSTFSPIGKPGSIAQAIAPTGADPFVQILENKDFTGNPIGPEGFPGASTKANSELLWSTTPKGYQSFARFVNEFTGGSAAESGGIDLKPGDYEILANFLTGSMGRFFSDTVFGIKDIATKDIEGPKDIPVIREFFSDPYDPMKTERYHTNIAAVYGAHRLEKMYEEGPDKDLIKLHEVRTERGEELRMYSRAQDIERQLKSLRVRVRVAQNRGDSERVKQLKETMGKIQEQFNATFKQRVG